jgi:dynactin-4
VNLRFSFTVTIADGIQPRWGSPLRSQPVLLVSPALRVEEPRYDYLIAQLQKFEDSAPDSLEFERLKDHFEPFIRASSLSSSTTSHAVAHPSSAAHSHHLHSNSITAAASAALARDIPGVGKYNPLARSTSSRGIGASGRDRSVNKDEMAEYRSRVEIAKASVVGTGGGDADVEFMRHLENVSEVASLDQRWENSWVTSLQTRFLFSLFLLRL